MPAAAWPSSPRLRRAYADGPGGQVHYYDSGGLGAALLLLHQSPTSAIDFADTFPHFVAAGFRTVAPDLPGMGMSDAPAEPPTIAEYAAAMFAVLDHAGVEQADAVGHHTGAQVAVAMAAAQPERIGALALYGVPVMEDEQRQSHWQAIVPRERDGGPSPPSPAAAI